MITYPKNSIDLDEVKEIEASLRYLFNKEGLCTDMELRVSRNLQEKYKRLMDWDKQILLGPVHPTS